MQGNKNRNCKFRKPFMNYKNTLTLQTFLHVSRSILSTDLSYKIRIYQLTSTDMNFCWMWLKSIFGLKIVIMQWNKTGIKKNSYNTINLSFWCKFQKFLQITWYWVSNKFSELVKSLIAKPQAFCERSIMQLMKLQWTVIGNNGWYVKDEAVIEVYGGVLKLLTVKNLSNPTNLFSNPLHLA